MTEWGALQAWDEMITAAIHTGQQHVREGQQAREDGHFAMAFEVLVRGYHKAVFGFCRNMVSGTIEEGVEDLAQEVFLAAWRTLPHFRHEASIRTWLFTIARHHCWDALRLHHRVNDPAVRDRNDTEVQPERPDPAPLPQELYEHNDFLQWVYQGLAQLDSVDREILVMTYMTELPPAEIAQILGIKEASVRQRRKRALDRLREIMTHEGRRARGF